MMPGLYLRVYQRAAWGLQNQDALDKKAHEQQPDIGQASNTRAISRFLCGIERQLFGYLC